MASTKLVACFLFLAAVLLLSNHVSAESIDVSSSKVGGVEEFEPDQLSDDSFCARVRRCEQQLFCVECCIREPQRERCHRCCQHPPSDFQNNIIRTETETEPNN